MENSSFQYKVSVIIPIYNSDKYLENCIESVLHDQGNLEEIEVILVNDGSTDGSAGICEQYAQKYSNVLYISKENEGLSATRNRGIQEAHGKYFLYLDSDDTLMPNTINRVSEFFDKHYNEVDLVTYPQIDIMKDGTMKKHFRYKILKESGIYDLNNYPYITQTRVNVMVKNLGQGYNVLFDTTPGFRHEDSAYNAYVLMDKMKIGFCNEGGYVYALNEYNITSNYFYAYYIFETSMAYYEKLFDEFSEKVPFYFQSLVLNDISWKLTSSKLFPFHYTNEKFAEAEQRIANLLKRMDDKMILSHPSVDNIHKYYFLSIKDGNYHIVKDYNGFALYNGKVKLQGWNYFEVFIQGFKLEGTKLKIKGMLSNPASLFLPMQVWVTENGDYFYKHEIEMKDSTYNFWHTKIKVANFRRFVYICDITKVHQIDFFGRIGETFYKTTFRNTWESPFDIGKGKTKILMDGYLFEQNKHCLSIKKLETAQLIKANIRDRVFHWKWDKKAYKERRKMSSKPPKKEIWLYNDANTNIENGLLQFRHDRMIQDGVLRYYIYDNEWEEIKHHFDDSELSYLVRFGSEKHKRLFSQASKILSAYAQFNYYSPFKIEDRHKFSDRWRYELIYLQHGILHASLPWQYGNDRMNIDKVIVSSRFELENMIKNYAFEEEELVPSGMVRFDYIDRTKKPKNKILIAPSWRHYLIGDIKNNRWTPFPDKFVQSEFYNKYMELFESQRLKMLLEQYDFELDFKLHPIFECYISEFHMKNDRIHLVQESVELSQYKICVTDFSSFVFDFVYCGRPILYFVPDYEKFKSGMHTYRELDIPLEDGFGELTIESEELIDSLEELLKSGCQIPKKYKKKTEDFFTCYDNHAKRTYEALRGNKEEKENEDTI